LIPAEGMDVSFPVLVVCCVGSFFCDGLITHAEESYRVCVSVCGLEISKGGGLGAIWVLGTHKKNGFLLCLFTHHYGMTDTLQLVPTKTQIDIH
jgi:hypothetical protein